MFEMEYGGVQVWSILGRSSRMVLLFYCHYHPSPVVSFINSPPVDTYLPFLGHNTLSSIPRKTLLVSVFAFGCSLSFSSQVNWQDISFLLFHHRPSFFLGNWAEETMTTITTTMSRVHATEDDEEVNIWLLTTFTHIGIGGPLSLHNCGSAGGGREVDR